jgi:ankyrin repeat protein
LHRAADAGHQENIACLIESNASKDARDLDQNTPLLLSVIQGHLETVKFLITNGADVALTNGEKQTILHFAAAKQHVVLLQYLLNQPTIKTLINSPDSDGKTPLHLTIKTGDYREVVELLLMKGADPNAKTTFQYTPMHWAAMHGRYECAKLLLSQNVDVDDLNANGDMPLDLAIRYGQDKLVNMMLGIERKEESTSLEQTSQRNFIAYWSKAQQHEEKALCLCKWSEFYDQKNKYPTAARILNVALAVVQTHCNNPTFEKYLFARLERIEGLFLDERGYKVPYFHRRYLHLYRKMLSDIRKQAASEMEKKTPISTITSELSNEFKKFFKILVENSISLLDTPPTNWACIGLGPIAREEMCPHSIINFAIIIQQKSSQASTYFQTLTRLLEIRMINLGLSESKYFQDKGENPTLHIPDGDFSEFPEENSRVIELIQTPQEIAQLVSPESFINDPSLANSLSTVCHLAGDMKLTSQFVNERNDILDTKDIPLFGTPQRTTIALTLVSNCLQESLSQDFLNGDDVTKIHKPLVTIIRCLSLFYSISDLNTFSRINRLEKLKVFSHNGANKLRQMLSTTLTCQFYHNLNLHHSESNEYSQIVSTLFQATKNFLTTKKRSSFFNHDFSSKSENQF